MKYIIVALLLISTNAHSTEQRDCAEYERALEIGSQYVAKARGLWDEAQETQSEMIYDIKMGYVHAIMAEVAVLKRDYFKHEGYFHCVDPNS